MYETRRRECPEEMRRLMVKIIAVIARDKPRAATRRKLVTTIGNLRKEVYENNKRKSTQTKPRRRIYAKYFLFIKDRSKRPLLAL